MNTQTILKTLWPIVEPRLVAWVAGELKAQAKRVKVELPDGTALEIAAWLIDALEGILRTELTDAEMLAAVKALAQQKVS